MDHADGRLSHSGPGALQPRIRIPLQNPRILCQDTFDFLGRHLQYWCFPVAIQVASISIGHETQVLDKLLPIAAPHKSMQDKRGQL